MISQEEDGEASALRRQDWSISAIARHLGRDSPSASDPTAGSRRGDPSRVRHRDREGACLREGVIDEVETGSPQPSLGTWKIGSAARRTLSVVLGAMREISWELDLGTD